MSTYDVVIIGAGVTGTGIARELSKYQLKTLLLDKENDVSRATSKANSGIVHAGYDPLPGTKRAKLNVLGCKRIHDLAKERNYHYRNIGSLVVGSTLEDHKKINELYERGRKNEVPDRKLLKTSSEVHKREPNLAKEIDYALYAPSAGVVYPWELVLARGNTAVKNGVVFSRDNKVIDITKDENGIFHIKTKKEEFLSKTVINAAGLYADEIYKMVLKDKKDDAFDITPVRGEYYLLDKEEGNFVSHVIFQTPTNLGKGVLVSPTADGNLIVGPDANENIEGKDDLGNTNDALAYIRNRSARSVPNVNFRNNIRNFAGNRATIKGREDFLIEESKIVNGFINFAGIKSPGLTSGPAMGIEAVSILKETGINLEKKKDFSYFRLPGYFSEKSLKEKEDLIEKNPLYGQRICRCETVTEGEILDTFSWPIPPCSIDGIKRRTNAGRGRCQGGFCGPKVFDILLNNLHVPFNEIYQDKTGSQVVVEKTKEGK